MDDFDPPMYEDEAAMDFVIAALNAGYEPFHFKSRETLYFGPAVMVDEPKPDEVSEELGVPDLTVESHSAGKYAVRMETSASLKEYGG